MNAQLPAHLQALGNPGLAARAAEGIGSSLPPHISIRGNQFTLVDSAGEKRTAQTTYLDVCIADISDVMCKMYYGDADGPKKWTSDSNDPPACWSANGVAPSEEAISPQSARCDTCEWNKRGSALAMDNKTPIKACRDEKWLAVLVPGIPMPLRMTLTPGSFTNWRAYTEMFRGKGVDMIHVFTRLTFEQDTNGVLLFALSPSGYVTEEIVKLILDMREKKASDVLVGRTDRPRQAALAAPAVTIQPQIGTDGAATVTTAQDQPQGFQPAPFGGAPSATSGTGAAASAPSATTTQPGSEAPRRRRRTAEQIAADNAAAAQAGGSAVSQAAPFAQAPAAQQGAPFGTPASNGAAGSFGIVDNAGAPPAGLNASLDSLFGPAGR